jgi:uncharacterized protein HemY
MINKFLAIAIILLFALLCSPIEALQNDFIAIELLDYRINLNLLFAFASVAALLLISRLIKKFFLGFFAIYHKFSHIDKYKLLQSCIVNLANSNIKQVGKILRKLSNEPEAAILVLKLLHLRAQKKYDDDYATAIEQAIEKDEIRPFALLEAIKLQQYLQNWPQLEHYAGMLWDICPNYELLVVRSFAYAKSNNWQGLLDIAHKAYNKGLMTRNQYKELRLNACYMLALKKPPAEKENAIKLLDSLGDNNCNIVMAKVQLNIEIGDAQKAIYSAKKAWKLHPSLKLVNTIRNLKSIILPEEYLIACRKIISVKPELYLSQLLLAEALLNTNEAEAALTVLKKIPPEYLDQEYYLIMTRCHLILRHSHGEISSYLNKVEGYGTASLPRTYWDFQTMSMVSEAREYSVEIGG